MAEATRKSVVTASPNAARASAPCRTNSSDPLVWFDSAAENPSAIGGSVLGQGR